MRYVIAPFIMKYFDIVAKKKRGNLLLVVIFMKAIAKITLFIVPRFVCQ